MATPRWILTPKLLRKNEAKKPEATVNYSHNNRFQKKTEVTNIHQIAQKSGARILPSFKFTEMIGFFESAGGHRLKSTPTLTSGRSVSLWARTKTASELKPKS